MVAAVSELLETEFENSDVFEMALREKLSPAEYQKYGQLLVGRAFSPVDCYLIAPTDRFGHYVGFIDLRPNSSKSPLAMGLPRNSLARRQPSENPTWRSSTAPSTP